MKTLIKTSFFIVLISIVISGCNNDLNEITYSDASASSYKFDDPFSAMGVVYAKLRSDFGHWDWYNIQETTSDEMCHPANASGWDDGGIYKKMHLHTWNSETPQLANGWNNFYAGVLSANRVIGQIRSGQVPISGNATKASLIGEMRVARALYYWLLLDNFGDAPLDTTALQGELLPKTPRKELYNFVVNEITQSIPNLSEKSDQSMYGRFNKWAAKALLANIYLNAHVYVNEPKWADCLQQCNDIIATGKYNLEANYKDIFQTYNENSKEIVFAVPFDEKVGSGFYVEMWSWNGKFNAKSNMQATPWGFGGVVGVPQFVDTYDAEDSRLSDTWLLGQQYALDGKIITASDNVTPFILKNSLPDGLYIGELEGARMNKFAVKEKAMSNLDNDFPLFRYAHILMMKAECLLRTNKADEAAAIVSQVRARAFKKNPTKATVTGAQLMGPSKYIYGYVENYKIVAPGNNSAIQFGGFLDELGWEFGWEAHRRIDNIRFGVFTTKSWLSHKPQGEYRTVFPIPQPALNANTLLVQNPAYTGK